MEVVRAVTLGMAAVPTMPRCPEMAVPAVQEGAALTRNQARRVEVSGFWAKEQVAPLE